TRRRVRHHSHQTAVAIAGDGDERGLLIEVIRRSRPHIRHFLVDIRTIGLLRLYIGGVEGEESIGANDGDADTVRTANCESLRVVSSQMLACESHLAESMELKVLYFDCCIVRGHTRIN
ncbi:hypothetical protein PMAYCL1PPCAC_00234, partial [Pristionchus mayeri]